MENQEPPEKIGKNAGFSIWIAIFFIVGQFTGAGILVISKALANTGWAGLLLIFFIALNALYAGICLSRCWNILEERYEEYRGKHRYPYPAIAYRAYGTIMQYVVTICIQISFVGVAIVYLLLSSELITKLTVAWGVRFCHWICILAAILCPLMWLGTPADMWPVAFITLSAVVISAFLIVYGVAEHAVTYPKVTPVFETPTFVSFFVACGSIIFVFGGSHALPTFQNDMADKTQFPTAIFIAFIIIILLHLPVAIISYAVYGSEVSVNVIDSLRRSWYVSTIYVLFSIRTIFAFVLIINGCCQQMEEIFKVPRKFGWKRVLLRCGILLFILFVALSIPRFGKILNLVGGSATNLACLIFPSLFYYKLCSQTDSEKKWPERIIPIHEKIYLVVIMISGIVGGCITTFSAFIDIIGISELNPPCYVDMKAAGKGRDPEYNSSMGELLQSLIF